MKTYLRLMAIAMVLGMVFIAGPVMADGNDTQTINYSVAAINELAVTGSPTFTINSATAGSQPDTGNYNSGTF